MASKYLSKIQIGKETVAGTAVAATAVWRGLGAMQDNRNIKVVDENVGYLPTLNRTYTERLLAAITFEQTEATFEQLPYLLNAGVKGVAGVQDGAGTGYVYTYPVSLTSANTPYTYTIEAGDGTQAEEMEYAFVKKLRLSWQAGQGLMMAADWVGRQVSLCSFTGALTIPSVEEIVKAKLYLDDSGGTIGTTQKTSTFLKMDMELETGFVERFTGDGQLYYTAHRMTKPKATMKIMFEHDAAALAAKVDWRAETTQLLKILFEGSALGTGATYTYKSLVLLMSGVWTSFNKLGEDDGNSVVEGTLEMAESIADTAEVDAMNLIVVNELSALP